MKIVTIGITYEYASINVFHYTRQSPYYMQQYSTAGIQTRVSAVSALTLFEIVSKAFRSVAFESIIPRTLGCKGL